MNQLEKVFNYKESRVSTIVREGEAWFIARDVCNILEINNVSLAVNGRERIDSKGNKYISGALDEDEKLILPVTTSGQKRDVLFVNESGVYELVFKSRSKEAKDFKRWLKTEALPSIRKHGAYMTEDTLEQAIANPDFTIGLLTKLKEEQETNKRLQEENYKKKLLLEIQAPKVKVAETFEASDDTVLVGELAKIVSKKGFTIGRNRLFEVLRSWGMVMKNKREPFQYYIDNGFFEMSRKSYEQNGKDCMSYTIRVTAKGQSYIINRLLKQGGV